MELTERKFLVPGEAKQREKELNSSVSIENHMGSYHTDRKVAIRKIKEYLGEGLTKPEIDMKIMLEFGFSSTFVRKVFETVNTGIACEIERKKSIPTVTTHDQS